jgi:hypothetical protein
MTDDGLEFQFRDMSEIRKKRAACSQIVAELYALVAALVRKRDLGSVVDWDVLEIIPIAGNEVHRVVLNAGDAMQLSLPGLASSRDLFRAVRPWLAARISGREFHLVVLNAGHLMQQAGTDP